MDYLKQFVIPFGGLKPGKHSFSFNIEDPFFEQFEFSEIKKGRVSVELDLEREVKMLVLDFILAGKVQGDCDRCSEPFFLPIEGKERLIVKFGHDFHEEDEEVQIIPEGETQIDLSPFIYEYIHLLVPVRRIHPSDENGNSQCDPEIIRRIEEREASSGPDPRWEVLNKLKPKIK